jgi:hypothetical protein
MHKGFMSLLFFAIVAVLILTHAQSFAAATTAVGGQTYGETALLTGNSTAASGSNITTTSTGGGKYSVS